MFGTFRFVLALMVVWYHLVDRDMSGRVAVFGFYCLSGYLMTRVVNETYGDGASGFLRYLANRALRIYPTYLATTALVIAALCFLPDTHYPPDMLSEANLVGALVLLLGVNLGTNMFIGAAWSLAVEIVHYVAIGAVLGRSRRAAILWFIYGVVLVVFGTIVGTPPEWFYFSHLGPTIAFAGGSLIWWFRDRLPRSRADLGFASIAVVAMLGIGMSRDIGMETGGLYIGLLCAALCIIYLRDLPTSPLDRRLGELAYPLFLIHMPTDMIVRGGGMIAVILTTFALSWAAVVLIERPVERLRGRLRPPLLRPLPQ